MEKHIVQEYFQMKAEKVFIGDPSYVMKEDLLRSIWNGQGNKNGLILSKDGAIGITASACGNKGYKDKSNHRYPTPMDALGVINLKLLKDKEEPSSRSGQIVAVPSGKALVDFSRDFGLFRIQIYDGVFSPSNLVYDEVLVPATRERIRER